jgi:hypothetical protein
MYGCNSISWRIRTFFYICNPVVKIQQIEEDNKHCMLGYALSYCSYLEGNYKKTAVGETAVLYVLYVIKSTYQIW